MSDDNVPTIVQTEEGELAFQEYFVRRQCHPRVKGFRFEGIQAARPAPGVLEALEGADAVVICPSNPWVSVEPILAVPGVRERLGHTGMDTGGNLRDFIGTRRKVVAVSPIIAGQAVKGPAAKMYAELGVEPSALAVARHYGGLLEGFVFDKQDVACLDDVRALGIRPLVTETLMKTPADRKRLAGEVLDFIASTR
jgi:LPPG:FO 2-phospho-L-lactate transferase